MLQTRVKAPELSAAVDWLNIDRPLSLEMLRGKIVLLDFWTFCCVDCMHLLPYLKQLEAQFPDELVVIGVHSAKFSNEKDSGQIRRAIERYGIEHPVANDARFALWEAYWVREWPTLVLIDPEGYIVQRVACSEKPYGKFEASIRGLIEQFDADGKLDRTPLAASKPPVAAHTSWLRYPGKIAADNDHLYIADSGHHRIVVMSHRGELQYTIGADGAAFADGDFQAVRFNSPQGLAVRGNKLYVADTENHRIRQIDLETSQVTTVAGTGKQALYTQANVRGGHALETDLSSPWDLAWFGERLLVCMAGTHQIWSLDPQAKTIVPFAGSSTESLLDGSLKEAQFAQPSGITTDGKVVFVADAETSSIRQIDPAAEKAVTTVVGTGLFDFGDRDGERKDVLLQHPLGVAWHNGQLYVCDSYNHKIKLIDPQTGTTRTLAGGHAGLEDGTDARFAEPGGLCFSGEKLFVADTNNHAIRRVNIHDGNVETIAGIEAGTNVGTARAHSASSVREERAWPNLRTYSAPAATLAGGSDGSILVDLKLPSGAHVNAEAPLIAEVSCSDSCGECCPVPSKLLNAEKHELPATLAVRWPQKPSSGMLTVTLQVVYCFDGEGSACHLTSAQWKVPVTFAENAGTTLSLST